MKKLMLALSAATFILFACNSDKTAGDSKTGTDTSSTSKTTVDPCAGYVADTSQQMPMDSAAMEMMNAMTAAGMPGAMHKMLANDDGVWEGEVTMWMDPKAPPTKSKTTASNRMAMGGRYQVSEHSGCFNGMPFEGMSIVGYDNTKQVFKSAWIDNMATSIMNLEGKYDSASKTIRLSGDCTNPKDGSMMHMREEFTYIDNDTQKMTMYGPDMTGKEFKSMEIVYKRKK